MEMTWITNGLTNVITLIDGTFYVVSQNTYLQILLVFSLAYICYRIIKKAKVASR